MFELVLQLDDPGGGGGELLVKLPGPLGLDAVLGFQRGDLSLEAGDGLFELVLQLDNAGRSGGELLIKFPGPRALGAIFGLEFDDASQGGGELAVELVGPLGLGTVLALERGHLSFEAGHGLFELGLEFDDAVRGRRKLLVETARPAVGLFESGLLDAEHLHEFLFVRAELVDVDFQLCDMQLALVEHIGRGGHVDERRRRRLRRSGARRQEEMGVTGIGGAAGLLELR